ncbi:hypothetical protein OYC64_007401 [Pagothenia borchgrevinki]|uniref:Uncharacterized protein n=1 Tax=Pagothenia borchgrevinki TaxID=8213 RepID=A0ABD2GSZ0_PAGBO
MMREGLSCWRR